MARALVLLAGIAAASGQQLAGGCGYKARGLTYDVSYLTSTTGDWTWEDTGFDLQTMNYTYTFQICGNVNNIPPACTSLSPPYSAGPYSAYQWYNNTLGAQPGCIPIGQSFVPGGPAPTTSLYDYQNPADGFIMSYNSPYPGPGADPACPVPGTPSRSLTLVFRCGYESFPPPNAANNPQATFVDEINQCNYEAYSWTLAGCPKECPVGGNGQLCTGNGICGWDKEIQSARCFCDDNYIDADCGNPANPVPSGAIAGAVISGLILGSAAILGYGFYLSRKGSSAVSVSDGFYGQV